VTNWPFLVYCYFAISLHFKQTVGAYVKFKDDILDIIVDSIIETVMLAMA